MSQTIGARKAELDTPALLIDLDGMEGNIKRMADFFANRPAGLRPHAKTHKCPIIAHKQILAGAIGITCAKMGEAEIMVEGGIRDILIANQIIGKEKIARLAALARHADIIVAVDDSSNLAELDAAAGLFGSRLGVVVDVDVGMGRCGVRSAEAALKLARQAVASKNVRFRGLMGYEGHCVFIQDRKERTEACHRANVMLVEAAEYIRGAGIEVELVSGGGTGTYDITGDFPGITEVEAGSYVFADARYSGVVDAFKPALSVLATVISRPERDIAIVDAGHKTMTTEFGMPILKGMAGVELASLSEEHGKLRLAQGAPDLRAGDKVEFIPSHGCTTINLHDHYCGMRGDRLETMWKIAARGKIR